MTKGLFMKLKIVLLILITLGLISQAQAGMGFYFDDDDTSYSISSGRGHYYAPPPPPAVVVLPQLLVLTTHLHHLLVSSVLVLGMVQEVLLLLHLHVVHMVTTIDISANLRRESLNQGSLDFFFSYALLILPFNFVGDLEILLQNRALKFYNALFICKIVQFS